MSINSFVFLREKVCIHLNVSCPTITMLSMSSSQPLRQAEWSRKLRSNQGTLPDSVTKAITDLGQDSSSFYFHSPFISLGV